MHSTTPTSGQIDPEEQSEFSKFGSFLKENIGQHLRDKCLDFSLSTSTALSADLDQNIQYTTPVFPIATSSSTTNNALLGESHHEQDQNVMPNPRSNTFDSAGGYDLSINYENKTTLNLFLHLKGINFS
jgi:hypothetical protein